MKQRGRIILGENSQIQSLDCFSTVTQHLNKGVQARTLFLHEQKAEVI